MATCAAAPGLLLIRRAWVPLVGRILLLVAALVWVETTLGLVAARQALGEPWLRMALILGTVALLSAVSALAFRTQSLRRRFSGALASGSSSAAAFLVVTGSLAVVQLLVENPMLLLERFLPGGGWLEILALGVYAAWLTEKMLDPDRQPIWRRRAWLLFSSVFFGQLLLGLAGLERLLMTGELHLPVPALIAAGPLFRGDGLFMPILFGATVLLVGPAWCSHLCYIGAWDQVAAAGRKRPRRLPSWTGRLRVALLLVVVIGAVGLRLAGVSAMVAGLLAAGFGLVGVAVMVSWSRRAGVMTHCVVFCPLGLLANLLGKLSLFRLRIRSECTGCLKCSAACRFGALSKNDIEHRRPGLTCSLCGDCVGRCEDRQIDYEIPVLGGLPARAGFVALVCAVHAAFLGVARI